MVQSELPFCVCASKISGVNIFNAICLDWIIIVINICILTLLESKCFAGNVIV